MAEAPTKPKFQPTPSRMRVSQKCATSTPVSPIAAEAAVKASPAATTRGAPKRAISRPVKKLGAYIAIMCHCRPRLDDSCDRPHRRIARGGGRHDEVHERVGDDPADHGRHEAGL